MPGTALVTINDNQWSVEVANTTTELIQGLSGVASIPAGTGMLFILPATQVVTVDTSQMLFPIDIIFIKDNAVLSIASNIEPGYLVTEETLIDMFLEVNALEAELVVVGDAVTVEIITTNGFDWSSIVLSFLPLVVLGFVFGITKGIMGGGSSSSNPSRRLGEPKTEAERKKTHSNLEELPSGYRPARPGEYLEAAGLIKITDAETGELKRWEDARSNPVAVMFKGELMLTELGKRQGYLIKDNKLIVEYKGGHSIHGEPRQRLVEEYGSWAVGRAEAICPEDDVACVTREAKRLIETIRSRYGEEAMEYVKITNPGKSVFYVGDTVSLVAFERENKRLRDIGEKEAIGEVAGV